MKAAEGAYLYWDWENVVFIGDIPMAVPHITKSQLNRKSKTDGKPKVYS